MPILLPKVRGTYDSALPLFFDAGPVRGVYDWRLDAYRMRERLLPGGFTAALPCRYAADHPLLVHRLSDGEEDPRQLAWEDHYLEEAALPERAPYGCIMFWLACQSEERPAKDGPYAMDTRRELGRWAVHLEHRPDIRVVIGAEEGFHGLSQIHFDYQKAYDRHGLGEFVIHDSLEATVAAAIKRSGA